MNSSRNGSTGFAPFELTGGYMPSMIRELTSEPALPGVKDFTERALDYLHQAHDGIIASRVEQTHHANRRRRVEDSDQPNKFVEGGQVYLSTANLNMPKGRAQKLLPKYIGPYKVISANAEKSTYTLGLPPELTARGIHPTFHASVLRPHELNDDTMFPHREANALYDFGEDPEQEWLVDDIVAHEWSRNSVKFLVQWTAGGTTWEPWAHVKDLEALDRYFEVQGVSDWRELAKPVRTTKEQKKRPPPTKARGKESDATRQLDASLTRQETRSGTATGALRRSARLRGTRDPTGGVP